MSESNPLYHDVPGAPYLIGQPVTVVYCQDEEDQGFLGLDGVVMYLEYECGCGQTYPGDPMIGVRLNDGRTWEFWREELDNGL